MPAPQEAAQHPYPQAARNPYPQEEAQHPHPQEEAQHPHSQEEAQLILAVMQAFALPLAGADQQAIPVVTQLQDGVVSVVTYAQIQIIALSSARERDFQLSLPRIATPRQVGPVNAERHLARIQIIVLLTAKGKDILLSLYLIATPRRGGNVVAERRRARIKVIVLIIVPRQECLLPCHIVTQWEVDGPVDAGRGRFYSKRGSYQQIGTGSALSGRARAPVYLGQAVLVDSSVALEVSNIM